ncbi:helix-turn-helix transcriptional regulator (plasmid) [Azospirillum sp. HJ39]|uniref:hypothetical protein n=1 Tax=Azospirillum sp. HJ39 TaxID=3159496 RepID=UPI003557606A
MNEDDVAVARTIRHSPVMLTGSQIKTLRTWARIETQDELGRRAGMSRATVARAEKMGDKLPDHLSVANMISIVKVFEQAGAQFYLPQGEALEQGVHIYYPPRPYPLPALEPKEEPSG